MATRKFRIDAAHQSNEKPPGTRTELLAEKSKQPARQNGCSAVDDSHQIERTLRHRLLSHPGLSFSSLVVRRFSNGLCLQGTIEVDGSAPPDVCELAREVAGVEQVINQLVVRSRDARTYQTRSSGTRIDRAETPR